MPGLNRSELLHNFECCYIARPDEYFKYTYGVTCGEGDPQTIELFFTPSQANYIQARHLHETQKIIRDDKNGLLIILTLIPNYELQQLILKYGPEVTVMKPASLRNVVKDQLKKALANYK